MARDTIHAPGDSGVTMQDRRTEWWLRSPFGIEVRFAWLGKGLVNIANADAVVVGRAFVEPWFPVDRLENEVSVMFGLSLGIYVGERNNAVPYSM